MRKRRALIAFIAGATIAATAAAQVDGTTNFAEEAIANLSGRLKNLQLQDNYYSSKAMAWIDTARTELSQTAIRDINQSLVNDLAYNAEQIIMSIEAGQTGYKQIAVPTVETKHQTVSRAKELYRLYQFKNCLTPLRGHFEVAIIYAQTATNFDVAYTRLAEINKRVIADQRSNCAEFTPIVPSGSGVATSINAKQSLARESQPTQSLAAILASKAPDDVSVYMNGDIASIPLQIDEKKDWYESINEALIPKGLEMKFDVSKRAVHLGPYMRTRKNDVPASAFSVNTLLAHWANKSNLSVTTEGALVDYALNDKVREEEYADDLRIAIQQLLAFYKRAGIPINAEIRSASIHITNQPKVAKETTK